MSVEIYMYIYMTLNLNRGDGVSVRARRRDGVDVAARVYGRGDGVSMITVSTQARGKIVLTLFVVLRNTWRLRLLGVRAIPRQSTCGRWGAWSTSYSSVAHLLPTIVNRRSSGRS